MQARLDEETQAALDRLRQSGLRTSEVIRKGIHLVAKEAEGRPPIKLDWDALQVFDLDASGVPRLYQMNVPLLLRQPGEAT